MVQYSLERIDFIDQIAYKFGATFWIDFSWQEDRAVLLPDMNGEEEAACRFPCGGSACFADWTRRNTKCCDHIWKPELVAWNGDINLRREYVMLACVDGVTWVFYRSQMVGTFGSSFTFRYFPHDHQQLNMSLAPKRFDELWPEPLPWKLDGVEILTAWYGGAGVTGWLLNDMSFVTSEWDATDHCWSDQHPLNPLTSGVILDFLRVSINVERVQDHYMLQVGLPAAFLAILALMTLALPPSDLGTRAGFNATLMVTFMAFQQLHSGELPQTDYRTKMDIFFMVMQIWMLTLLGLSCLQKFVHRYHKRSRASRGIGESSVDSGRPSITSSDASAGKPFAPCNLILYRGVDIFAAVVMSAWYLILFFWVFG